MTLQDFVLLCARAWTLPALALIHEGVPARVSPLAAAAGASRAAMAASLTRLEELALLQTNEGHGHPLRPAVRLTRSGKRVAGAAVELMTSLRTDAHQAIARKTWPLPVLAVLDRDHSFGELRRELAPVTDRALSQTLKALQLAGLVVRAVDDEGPSSRFVYRPAEAALPCREVLAKLVRYRQRTNDGALRYAN